ncbi:hypothetical protein [Microbacterium paludicola]|uniref:hypothetical protein n=1 Tax=Microbacterium paludicola TaxID=300019 RepID=UPI0011A11262|nr:hypothetical protein [Microbacterium paludicola]
MALMDALKTPPADQRRMNVIEAWRAKLDSETRSAFDAAVLNVDEWTPAALVRVLADHGFEVTHQTVVRYRQRAIRRAGE